MFVYAQTFLGKLLELLALPLMLPYLTVTSLSYISNVPNLLKQHQRNESPLPLRPLISSASLTSSMSRLLCPSRRHFFDTSHSQAELHVKTSRAGTDCWTEESTHVPHGRAQLTFPNAFALKIMIRDYVGALFIYFPGH